MDQVLLSSQRMDWETPRWLVDKINDRWGLRTLDVCATEENRKCEFFITTEQDAFIGRWPGGKAFMNPPYGSSVGKWIRLAAERAWAGEVDDIICLIPSRTDTRYWHDYVMRAREVCLLRGRIRFVGAPHPAPFPSCMVIFQQGSTTPMLTSMDIRKPKEDK